MNHLIDFLNSEFKGSFEYPENTDVASEPYDIFESAFYSHWVKPHAHNETSKGYRASSIGKNLWVLAWEKFNPNNNISWKAKRKIFSGFTFECFTAYILNRLGYKYNAQEETNLGPISGSYISGHPDFIVDDSFIIECKELTGTRFNQWVNKGIEADYHYAVQLGIYMLSTGISDGLFIIGNRDTGEIHTVPVNRDKATDLITEALFRCKQTVEFLESITEFEDCFGNLTLPSIPKTRVPQPWLWLEKGVLHPVAYELYLIDDNLKIEGYNHG